MSKMLDTYYNLYAEKTDRVLQWFALRGFFKSFWLNSTWIEKLSVAFLVNCEVFPTNLKHSFFAVSFGKTYSAEFD